MAVENQAMPMSNIYGPSSVTFTHHKNQAVSMGNLYSENTYKNGDTISPWSESWNPASDADVAKFNVILNDQMKGFKFEGFTINMSKQRIIKWKNDFPSDWNNLMTLCLDHTECGFIVDPPGDNEQVKVYLTWDRSTPEGARFFQNFESFNKFLDVLIKGTVETKHKNSKTPTIILASMLVSGVSTNDANNFAKWKLSVVKLAYFKCVVEYATEHRRRVITGETEEQSMLKGLVADIKLLRAEIAESKQSTGRKIIKKKVF